MTIKTTTSLAVLIKPQRTSAPRPRARTRQSAIDELEVELARINARGESPELAKLAKRELVIEKNKERGRQRLRKQYAELEKQLPYVAHDESPRASLALLKLRKDTDMTTKPITASPTRVSLAKLKLKAPDAPVVDASGEKHEVAGLIKGLHKSGGVALHLPQALRKGSKK